MSQIQSLNEKLQRVIADHLSRDRSIGSVPILKERLDDIENLLQESVARGTGKTIIIWNPRPLIADTAATTPQFNAIETRIRVTAPAGEASKPGLLKLTEAVMRRMHGYAPPLQAISAPYRLREEYGWVFPELPGKDKRLSIDLVFHTTGNYSI